jgi:hypothetical protein
MSPHPARPSPSVPDPVNHPRHYNAHPSGRECIEFTQHMDFLLGNAFKYVWRHHHKNGEEDLRKALWYLDRYLLSAPKRKFPEAVFLADSNSLSGIELLIYKGWMWDDRVLLEQAIEQIEELLNEKTFCNHAGLAGRDPG